MGAAGNFEQEVCHGSREGRIGIARVNAGRRARRVMVQGEARKRRKGGRGA